MCGLAVTLTGRHEERVAVGAALATTSAPMLPPAPRAVLDQHRLAPDLAELLAEHARETSVAPPAGTARSGAPASWATALRRATPLQRHRHAGRAAMRGAQRQGRAARSLHVMPPVSMGSRKQRQREGQRPRRRSRQRRRASSCQSRGAPNSIISRRSRPQVRGQQHHEAPLGELQQRLVGPAQETHRARFALQRLAERPEMQRQEEASAIPETRCTRKAQQAGCAARGLRAHQRPPPRHARRPMHEQQHARMRAPATARALAPAADHSRRCAQADRHVDRAASTKTRIERANA